MENPMYWTRATNVVHNTIQLHNKEPQAIGPSLPSKIVNELQIAGFLNETGLEVVGIQRGIVTQTEPLVVRLNDD